MTSANMHISKDYELKDTTKVLRKFYQITAEQVSRLLDTNEANAKQILARLKNSKLIRETNIPGKYVLLCAEDIMYDFKREKAMDLAITLIKQASDEYSSFLNCVPEQEEPFCVWLCVNGEEYDIIYIEANKEKIMSNKIKRLGMDTNYVAIIEHKEQLSNLNIENLTSVYLVTKEGNLEYVER